MKFILEEAGLDALKAIAYIIDTEEEVRLFHLWRVAALAKYVAEKKCREAVLPVYIAGLLHDVGIYDIPNRLIHIKEHMENIKDVNVLTHPQKGAAIVSSLHGFIPIAKVILDHHEWVNGKGYPRGLKGDEIRIESQILRLADKTAFLIDTDEVRDLKSLKRALDERVDKEFSRCLYECLMEELNKDNLWGKISEDKDIVELTQKMFKEIHIEKGEGLRARKDLFIFFGRALDAKHAYTEGHARRVSYFSVIISLALNLPDKNIEQIEAAAFLHDIGKLGIPKRILDKKGPLTRKEFQIIKTHAALSYEIVKGIHAFQRLANIVGADQEHWDGSGYPVGLKKEEIPIGARIIFVADAFDAMTSNRSYHKAVSVEKAIEELKRCAGADFDPEIVEVASMVFRGLKNPSILASYENLAERWVCPKCGAGKNMFIQQ